MSLGVSKGLVVDAAKKLKAAWLKTRRDWDDDMAKRFEAEFLDPLPSKIKSAVDGMDNLAAITARAERECG